MTLPKNLASKFKKFAILVILVFSILALVTETTHATHWPFGMLHNSADGSLSRGYFTQRNITGVGPAVLPSYNYNGTECTGYTYTEWQAAGSPLGSQLFAIPNSVVWAGNLDSGNDARKQQLYDHLRQLYSEGSNDGTCLERQKFFGASFIVNTMLGITSNQVNNNATLGSAKWNDFYARLMQSNIHLSSSDSFARDENSFIARRDYLAGLAGPAARDVGVHIDRKTEPTILLRQGGATGTILYALKRRCANPTGNFPGLPPPPPPAPISCGNITTNPPSVGAGQQFTITASFSVGSGPGPDVTYSMWISLPAAGLNNNQVANAKVAARGSSGTGTSPPRSIAAAGEYSGSYRVEASNSTPATLVCPFTIKVVSKPYFRVYGGDTFAGAGFFNGTSCPTDQNASIIGWNSGAPPYTGAGSQLGAFSLGELVDFSSGQLRAINDPNHLSFANTNPSHNGYGNSTYGGGLMATAGHAVCAEDYFAGHTDGTFMTTTNTSAKLDAGKYYWNNDLVINATTIGLGEGSRTYYVNGNVRITGDINYANGNYNGIDKIPKFRLVVRGNIRVAPNVTQLDGVYIAQSNPGMPQTTGWFYTCWPGHIPTAADLNGVCRNNRLTVYGAVVAELIKLTRSQGSASQSNASEAYDSNTGAPAEVFIYTPEVWLVDGIGGDKGGLDTMTALPPIL